MYVDALFIFDSYKCTHIDKHHYFNGFPCISFIVYIKNHRRNLGEGPTKLAKFDSRDELTKKTSKLYNQHTQGIDGAANLNGKNSISLQLYISASDYFK